MKNYDVLGIIDNSIFKMTLRNNTSILKLLPKITIAVVNFCVIYPSFELIKFQTLTVINLTEKFSS